MKLYYRVVVTHYPEGYDPYTVEYGVAETNYADVLKTLERAQRDFPESKASIETISLESY
jgi:hypothetical protein